MAIQRRARGARPGSRGAGVARPTAAPSTETVVATRRDLEGGNGSSTRGGAAGGAGVAGSRHTLTAVAGAGCAGARPGLGLVVTRAAPLCPRCVSAVPSGNAGGAARGFLPSPTPGKGGPAIGADSEAAVAAREAHGSGFRRRRATTATAARRPGAAEEPTPVLLASTGGEMRQ